MRIDSHCHIFNSQCMLPWQMAVNRLRCLGSGTAFDPQYQDNLGTICRHLFSFLAGWWISRQDMAAIRDRLLRCRHTDLWVVLTLNADHAYPGRQPRLDFNSQLLRTSRLTLASRGRILPFYCFDPRAVLDHDDPLAGLRDGLENRGCVGVKLYPSFGYSLFGNQEPEIDRIMQRLFTYCCRHQDGERSHPIPITAHCSWSAGGFSGAPPPSGASPMRYYRALSAPRYWRSVLREFPRLKLNLAHFGGLGEWYARAGNLRPHFNWIDEIADLCRRHANVYTDLSFHVLVTSKMASAYGDHLRRVITGMEEKVLLGSDWYLSRGQCTLDRYWSCFADLLGADLLHRFTGPNPARFLRSDALCRSFPDFFSRQGVELVAPARALCLGDRG